MNVLLPFKGLDSAKTRWPDLPRKREILIQLLGNNLEVVASVVGHQQTYLVSPDPEALSLFKPFQALLVCGGGLNQDLELARLELEPSQALAVVLPDLPFLSPEDVKELTLAADQREVTICPDQAGVGTNALVLNPARCLDFCFEGESARQHWQLATERGLKTDFLKRPGLAQDCDQAEDLERYALL